MQSKEKELAAMERYLKREIELFLSWKQRSAEKQDPLNDVEERAKLRQCETSTKKTYEQDSI